MDRLPISVVHRDNVTGFVALTAKKNSVETMDAEERADGAKEVHRSTRCVIVRSPVSA